jgi:acyl carrier protein
MEISDFIKNFSNQFDDTESEVFMPNTTYKDLDEWSSLTALAVINMINKKYNVNINNDELKSTSSIQELFDLVQSKQ